MKSDLESSMIIWQSRST